MRIGDAIRRYRMQQGMTQLQLAERINKSARTIMRYEKGYTMPSIPILEKIFNKSIHDLICYGLMED